MGTCSHMLLVCKVRINVFCRSRETALTKSPNQTHPIRHLTASATNVKDVYAQSSDESYKTYTHFTLNTRQRSYAFNYCSRYDYVVKAIDFDRSVQICDHWHSQKQHAAYVPCHRKSNHMDRHTSAFRREDEECALGPNPLRGSLSPFLGL